MSLTLGEARSFSARALDGQGNTVSATLFWSSENAAIATVSDAGVVTAIGVGSTRVAASAGGKASVATVNVSARPVSSVRVSPSSTRIEVGRQSTLTASAFDAGGAPLLGLTATWATANPDVATIDDAGVVTAVAAGVATVSATIGGASGTAVIHVDAVPVASVRITPATGALLEGETLQLNAAAVDGSGNALAGRVIAWRSSAVSIASVSSDGLVVGFTAGSATITATSEGKSGTATIAVSPIPVAAIEVTPGSVIVSAGNSIQFTALARDKNGNVLNRPLTWTTDQPAVATVSSKGLASALRPGTARITATSEGKTGSATLTINPIPVASVTITPATTSLQTGDTTSLTAVTRDAAGNVLPGRLVTWLSGAPNVTSVSSTGLVTAVGTGSAIVFATSEGVSGTSAINVTAPPAAIASISVSPTVVVVQPGGTRQLTAVARDAAGNILTGRTLIWSTSAANVATVNATGLVTAITDGATTITASNGSVTGSATVSVVTPVSTITVAPSTANLLIGDTRQFAAVGRDDVGNVLPGRVYTWISSAPSVATVSNLGLVTAVGAGTATISAWTGGISGTATVTVTVPTPVIASIDVTPSTATLKPNDLQPLTAVAKDAAGVVIPNPSFVWSSGATGVATVSATGAVTAIAAGTATIRASSAGVDGTATITVTAAPVVVASISITPASASLSTGDVQPLTATAKDAGGNVLGGISFTWTSSATSVATVSSAGSVTAIGAGSATITASSGNVGGTAAIVVTPPAPVLSSITVSPATANLQTSDVRQLTAAAKDAAGNAMSGISFTWTSSATAVATVSSTGSVTAVGAGSATITASSAGVSGTAAIVVTTPAPVVASVTVSPATANMLTNDVRQLTATAQDAAGTVIGGAAFTWTSSATSVATVSATGSVTAVGAGSATITASSAGVSGTAAIVVTTPTPVVASVTISPATASLLTGGTQQLTATAKDASGAVITGQTFTWTSSATSVATVSSTGSVTAVGAGAATITASTGSVNGTAAIGVTTPPPVVASVTVSPATTSLLAGGTQPLVATAKDASGAVITGQTFTWTTSASQVATVSSGGLVTAVAAGAAIITATSGTVSGTSAVTVTVPPPTVATVSVTPTGIAIMEGQGQQLTATALDASGKTIPGKSATWTTSDATVATVSTAGMLSGVRAGTVTITATIDGIAGTAPYTVTMIPVQSVTLTPTNATILTTQTISLSATLTGPNGQALSPVGRTFAWTSSNASIATVSSTGVVSGVAAGTATISLTVEGKVGTATIVVQLAQPSGPPAVGSVAFVPDSVDVQLNGTQAGLIQVLDVNGKPAVARSCVLVSQDASRASVTPTTATTDALGNVAVTFFGGKRHPQRKSVIVSATCERITGTVQVYVL